MGTVGLSFGTPTSGTGFNVSSTVAEIVSNLQNVETPWKTQLTSLQSQDTVISSLGTLFSNLSNDMSSLTDFQGVMALKEGSSSDTGVLTLTAADSTAVAGTHTVTVSNLAQTSSGYLTQIASASDTLSGSITLQAGSGAQLTLTLNSSDNTLADLAATINSSAVGITASVLTDAQGSLLSLVSNTSGAAGNVVVSANSIVAIGSTALSYTDAGTASGTTPDSGALAALANASDTLSGSLSIQVGAGTAQTIVVGAAPSGGAAANTIYTGSGVNTLSGIEDAINTAGIGVTASIVNNSLSLLSNTAGSAGTLTVTSGMLDNTALGYTNSVTGADASLTVDGVALTSASNTVANLIPGVTFQLLAPSAKESDSSLEQVQVVIGNDNTGVESTMVQMVSDYNSLISAVNAQEGLDSSGNAEPLFGSPTLSLLQQQLLSGLNMQSPNGSLTAIGDGTGTTLSGSMTIQVGSGGTLTVVVGSGTDTANTVYTGSGSGYNTLSGLEAAINAAGAGTTLSSTVTAGSNSVTSSATLTSVNSTSDMLSGSLSVQVGSGTTENIVIGAEPGTGAAADTIYTGSGVNTLSGLASAINANSSLGFTANVTTATDGSATLALTSGTSGSAGTLTVTPQIFAAGLGLTASVVTANGQSSLSMISQTEGSGGALTVSSSIVATSATALTYTDSGLGGEFPVDIGTLGSVGGAGDALTGSITIQVGTGQTETIAVPPASATSPSNNLAGLAGAINSASIGVNASVVENSDGSYSLSLQSETLGSSGDMTVTSNILDTADTNSTNLSYSSSSDISSLTTLGMSVNNDGSLSLDVATLDSLLNSDYSGAVGFFQNASGWGQTFSTMLTNAGTGSPTGILALSSSSNSNIESTLNADITREESLISVQQVSLTNALNQANEIMQELPTQLEGVNELYSAITGYNQNSDG